LTTRSTLVVEAMNASSSNTNAYICKENAVTRTKIKFKRGQGLLHYYYSHCHILTYSLKGDIPAMSFYSTELFTTGSVYFETTQTLTCDCTSISCSGTFYLSFDGEMTSKIAVTSSASAIKTALGKRINDSF